jgi:hypothetical protein
MQVMKKKEKKELSEEDLIEKYEKGQIDLKEAVKKILDKGKHNIVNKEKKDDK